MLLVSINLNPFFVKKIVLCQKKHLYLNRVRRLYLFRHLQNVNGVELVKFVVYVVDSIVYQQISLF